jgi:undecaprenyl-diphosphatase
MHNYIDTSIAQFFNQYVHRSYFVDSVIFQVTHNHLFKGAVLMALICLAWLKVKADNMEDKKRAFLTIFFVAMLAEVIARLTALLSPFRYRPLNDQTLHLVMPYNVNKWLLDGWSSFPSDHAALFFAMAASIYFIHKRIGLFALAYTTLFICIPRVVLGFHFLSDVLFGAFIGIACAWLGFKYVANSKPIGYLACYSSSKPEYFYPLLMLFSYQLCEMFERSRELLSLVYHAIA